MARLNYTNVGSEHQTGPTPPMKHHATGERWPARQVTVDTHHEGQRIDNFLRGCLKDVPKSHIYRILRKGEVRVNKGRVRQDYRLSSGDVVRIPPLRHQPSGWQRQPGASILQGIADSILYEDDGLLVLNKPSGMAVHGGSGCSYGVIEALRVLRDDAPFLALVHRLDRETSGCLMVAKSRRTLTHLHECLRNRRVDKHYVALTRGRWPATTRRVETGLRRSVLHTGERVVRPDPAGKQAITVFQPLVIDTHVSLLSIKAVTGRMHQIRVQAATLGHPIAGDEKYGDREFNESMRRVGLKRLFLHAHSVAYRNSDGQRVKVLAPLGADLSQALSRAGLNYETAL